MHQAIPRKQSPDPRQYTRSVSDATKYYYRHETDGGFGPDNLTWVPPQTAPTAPPLGVPAQGPMPVAPPSTTPSPGPSTPYTAREHRLRSASPPRYRSRSRSRSPHRRRYSRSPPRHQEYAHEYGAQHRGHGYASGPQHYRPARMRSRSPPRRNEARNHELDDRRDNRRDSRREVYSNSRPIGASFSTTHRSSPARHGGPGSRTAAPAPAARSFASTPAPSTPPLLLASNWVAIPHPVLATAHKDDRGVPWFPVNDEESDYVGTSDDDDAGRKAQIAKYKKAEKDRMRRISKKAASSATPPRTPMARDATMLGPWATVKIESLRDAFNLLSWSNSGEPHARRLVLHLEQEFGIGSSLHRNEGIAYVMGKQADSARAYLYATTGVVKITRSRAPPASPFKDEDITIGDDLPMKVDAPAPTIVLTPVLITPEFVPAYLGASAAATVGDGYILGPQVSAHAAVAHYAGLDTSDWPRAMRDDSGHYPTARRARPHFDDVRAHLTVQFLSPVLDGSTPNILAQAQFIEQVMLMFSAEGMFERHVAVGRLRYAEITIPDHYIVGTSIDFTNVAVWFHSHGLAMGSPDVRTLEAFARSCRNRIAGNSDPLNRSFAAWPHDGSCTAMVSADDIIAAAALVNYDDDMDADITMLDTVLSE